MKRSTVFMLLLGFALAAIPTSAIARVGVLSRAERSKATCRAVVSEIVSNTTVGEPPVPLGGGWRHRRVVGAITDAIDEGVTAENARAYAYARLGRIENNFFRNDIAAGIASVVEQAKESDACE